MRGLFLISVVLLGFSAWAQQDTTRQVKAKLTQADSVSERFNNKIDSIQGKANKLLNPNLNLNSLAKDKLNKQKEKRDSVQFYKNLEKEKRKLRKKIASLEQEGRLTEAYTKQLDSLNEVKYEKDKVHPSGKRNQLNSKRQSITHQKDSLLNIGSANPYKTKLDSITQSPTNLMNKAEGKIEGEAGSKMNKVTAPAHKVNGAVNEKLSLMNQEGGAGANIPTNTNLPNTSLPNDVLPQTNLNLSQTDLNVNNPLSQVDNPLKGEMNEAGEITNKVGEMKGLPQEQIGKLKSIDEVKEATGEIGKANVITDKAQGYTGDVKNLTEGNLSEMKNTSKALEGQASKIDGVGDIQKEAGQFSQYSKLSDQEAMQQELKKQAMEQMKPAVNHFEGKEDVLKAAMDKMSKLKLKHTNLNSLKDITKRVVNEMNGKPFIERMVPGITLQIQHARGVVIDYNPYLGYRISGKLTAGAGWNERFKVSKHFYFSLNDRIFGPRVFADLKIGKGFSVRTDIEKMNTRVSSVSPGPNDLGHREWIWSAFVGIKKEYRFAGSVKGNAQFLYNLYDDHNNSPYGDRLVVRMGFEFPLKKKVKLPKDEIH
jgi:hypothetical protein